jgi:hypothetical protein
MIYYGVILPFWWSFIHAGKEKKRKMNDLRQQLLLWITSIHTHIELIIIATLTLGAK